MKFIASDLDGTLLLDKSMQVSQEMFRLISKYQEQGVLFCAASGRQYNSLRGLFAPVAEDLVYVCENGAVVFYKGEVLGKTCIPRADALAICRSILAQPNCEVLISGERTSYLLPKQEDYVDHIQYFVGNHVTLVPALEAIPEEILKVSAFCRDGAVKYEEPLGRPWKEKMNVAVSGRRWLDFTVAGKEDALEIVHQKLGISPAEMVSFGDNFNDVGMLRYTGRSFAMQSAPDAVKQAATGVCTRVEQTLAQLYEELFEGRGLPVR